MRRWKILIAAGALATGAGAAAVARGSPPAPAPAQQPGLIRVRVIGGDDGAELFGVKDAAFAGRDLVVVTAPEPAVHLFGAARPRAWGKKGSGPAELRDPSSVAVVGDRILVYDLQLMKIASFTTAGAFVSARSVGVAAGVKTSGRDTLVAVADLTGGTRTVVRLRGARADTVLRFRLPTEVRLTADGSPVFSVPPPFSAIPVWTPLSGGRVAFWDGSSPFLQVRALGGAAARRIPLPAAAHPVSAADRELWLAEAIPTEFMGRRVFEPIRAEARRSLRFPARFPPALELMGDPAGGVWVRRTTRATGETWILAEEGGVRQTIRLPAGRSLLAVGAAELAVLARDADDVESIEIYRRPGPAPARGD